MLWPQAVRYSTLRLLLVQRDQPEHAVTYLFRTTGQVIGVSLSGALLQTVLTAKLRERIHGPNAVSVRHHIRRMLLPCPADCLFSMCACRKIQIIENIR